MTYNYTHIAEGLLIAMNNTECAPLTYQIMGQYSIYSILLFVFILSLIAKLFWKFLDYIGKILTNLWKKYVIKK